MKGNLCFTNLGCFCHRCHLSWLPIQSPIVFCYTDCGLWGPKGSSWKSTRKQQVLHFGCNSPMQQYVQGTCWLGSRSTEKRLEALVGKLNKSQQSALVLTAQTPCFSYIIWKEKNRILDSSDSRLLNNCF